MLSISPLPVPTSSSIDATTTLDREQTGQVDDMNWKDQLWGHQALSMFERMTAEEIHQMFEVTGDQVTIRPWLKQGIRGYLETQRTRTLFPHWVLRTSW
jgi:hypothetical protein